MRCESKKSNLRSFSRVDLLLLSISSTEVINTPCLEERSRVDRAAILCLPIQEAVCSTRAACLRDQACRPRRKQMRDSLQ